MPDIKSIVVELDDGRRLRAVHAMNGGGCCACVLNKWVGCSGMCGFAEEHQRMRIIFKEVKDNG